MPWDTDKIIINEGKLCAFLSTVHKEAGELIVMGSMSSGGYFLIWPYLDMLLNRVWIKILKELPHDILSRFLRRAKLPST